MTDTKIPQGTMKIWECKIGEVDVSLLPHGADLPMRHAVSAEFKALTGVEPKFIFSGWGAELTESERAVVENRLPKPSRDQRQAVPDDYYKQILENILDGHYPHSTLTEKCIHDRYRSCVQCIDDYIEKAMTESPTPTVKESLPVATPPSSNAEGAVIPEGLHPETANLVIRFASALADKLYGAEQKYGYSDGWRNNDWMNECRQKLMEHIAKGDPRDVAAYCAFLWHHGESTAATTPPAALKLRKALKLPDVDVDLSTVHIMPSEFQRISKTEAVGEVYSVPVSSPDERSLPLWTTEQMQDYARQALLTTPTPPASNAEGVEVTGEDIAAMCGIEIEDSFEAGSKWAVDDDDLVKIYQAGMRAAPPAADAKPDVEDDREWKIDTSTGRDVLTYKNCSVIEDEQARQILTLIQYSEKPYGYVKVIPEWGSHSYTGGLIYSEKIASDLLPVFTHPSNDAMRKALEDIWNAMTERKSFYDPDWVIQKCRQALSNGEGK